MQGKIRYELIALLHSGNTDKMMARLDNVQIYRPKLAEAFKPAQYQGEKQVGGYFGWQMQTMHTEFVINTSSFAPGDQI